MKTKKPEKLNPERNSEGKLVIDCEFRGEDGMWYAWLRGCQKQTEKPGKSQMHAQNKVSVDIVRKHGLLPTVFPVQQAIDKQGIMKRIRRRQMGRQGFGTQRELNSIPRKIGP